MRAIPMPTSPYAAPEDWGSADLGKRIARAAGELAVILRSRARRPSRRHAGIGLPDRDRIELVRDGCQADPDIPALIFEDASA